MNAPTPTPRVVGDLSLLPTHAFGHRSLTWWGVMGFMVIEGMGFALAIAAYFFLLDKEHGWAPPAYPSPDLLPGILFLALVLLSEIPNTWVKRAAERYDLAAVRRGLVVMSLIVVPLVVLRWFELLGLNVWWYDNAYGSVLWLLLFLHTLHLLTDWGDTLVLTALMHTGHGEESKSFVDTSENALYWRFIWGSWLVIWPLIYLLPRWLR